jgi:DNA-binding Lrp family transcriptional regulator
MAMQLNPERIMMPRKTYSHRLSLMVWMPTAYVFIHCTAGSEEKLIRDIAKIKDVSEVRGTYGVYDIFVKVKSEDNHAVNRVISETIRKMKGVSSTNTLIAIEGQGGKEFSDAVALKGR